MYSVYKIGDSFIAFLLIIIFLLLMAAISNFFHDCETSDNFDTFLGPLSFSQQKMHLKCIVYCKIDNCSLGVNHKGALMGLCMTSSVFLTVGGCGCRCDVIDCVPL